MVQIGFLQVTVNVSLPLGNGQGLFGTWKPDKDERDAAWEMYVELVTRATVVELQPGEGLLREALASYYSLFETTRRILRDHGPAVARPKGRNRNRLSFAEIAVGVLNGSVRPLLAKWHPLLQDYESQRPPLMSPMQHERSWTLEPELRSEINRVRKILILYADLLAKIANVPQLTGQSAENGSAEPQVKGA